jgi:hypothetical protein
LIANPNVPRISITFYHDKKLFMVLILTLNSDYIKQLSL